MSFNCVDHIYVICSREKEPERVKNLESIFEVVPSSKVTFVEPYWRGRDSVNVFVQHLGNLIHRLQVPAGLLYMTFYNLCEKIASGEQQIVLVLESDVLVKDKVDWINKLNQAVNDWKQIPNYEKSMLFLGNGCSQLTISSAARRVGDIYEMNEARCCDSMIWTKQMCQDVLPFLKPIIAPIDIFLNHYFQAHDKHGHKAYWLDPPIFSQGSQNGTFSSSVQQEDILYLPNNQIYLRPK
jgi:hypothetical protein